MFMADTLNYITDLLPEDWHANGQLIALNGLKISPPDLLNIQRKGTYQLEGDTGNDVSNQEAIQLLWKILIGYRLAMIRDSISTEYKDRVAEKLKAFFSLEPWYVKNISTHPLSINVTGWLNSVSFTSLIAVTDMFFVRFRNHHFSGARIATLVSRMKGAAALTSLIDLRNSTNLEFGTLRIFPDPRDATRDRTHSS